jgi:hypothetical protein
MSVGQIDHQLVEVAVTDKDKLCAAAVKIATLTREREKSRVDE